MNVVKSVQKTKDEALRQVLAELNASEEEVIYSFQEIKGGLFKGVTYECSGFYTHLRSHRATPYPSIQKIVCSKSVSMSFKLNSTKL